MRISYRVIAILFVWIVSISSADVRAASAYSDQESECVAKAVWHEGGSTGTSLNELRLMVHSIKMRGLTKDWYYRNSWGGPHLCHVTSRPRQYSYRQFPHKDPFKKPDMWSPRVLMEMLVAQFSSKTKKTDEQKASEERTFARIHAAKTATKDVLSGVYIPPHNLKEATTYKHKCMSDIDFDGKDSCHPRLKKESDASKCYFRYALVMLDGQTPVNPEQRHIFYRAKTLEEARVSIQETPPPICTKAARTVEIVRAGWQEWIGNPDRKPVEVFEYSEPKKPAGKGKKKRKRHQKKQYEAKNLAT
jgi:hypothetical protein